VDVSDREHYAYGDFRYAHILQHQPQVDVLCQHGRFHYANMKANVGGDATFVTILRKPIDQFISMWNFYRMNEQFQANLSQWVLSEGTPLASKLLKAKRIELAAVYKDEPDWSLQDFRWANGNFPQLQNSSIQERASCQEVSCMTWV